MRKILSFAIVFLTYAVAAHLSAIDDLTLLKAAHNGDVDSMRRIGIRMYRGCSRGNPSLGIEWLKKASENGDCKAMYCLGRIYYDKGNKDLAHNYLVNAATRGNIKAESFLHEKGLPFSSQGTANIINLNKNCDSTTGNKCDEGFDTLINSLEKENQSFPLIYEFECTISDDYEIPEQIVTLSKNPQFQVVGMDSIGSKTNGAIYGVERSAAQLIRETGGKVKARTKLHELGRQIYQNYLDKSLVKRALILGALIGRDGYIGPMQVCLLMAQSHFAYINPCGNRQDHFFSEKSIPWVEWCNREVPKYESGIIKESGSTPGYTYQCSMTWKDGFPYKVRCRLDFSISKKRLVKKQ